MKFTSPENITSAMRETARFTVTRLEDGKERVQNTEPRIQPADSFRYLVWDNPNNRALSGIK